VHSNSDSYHTCYVLAGLSSSQHLWNFISPVTERAEAGILNSAFQWSSKPIIETAQIFDEEDRVGTLHPVFVIPEGVAEDTRAYFARMGGF
jgi:protein farnesyltransferase subunit beta